MRLPYASLDYVLTFSYTLHPIPYTLAYGIFIPGIAASCCIP